MEGNPYAERKGRNWLTPTALSLLLAVVLLWMRVSQQDLNNEGLRALLASRERMLADGLGKAEAQVRARHPACLCRSRLPASSAHALLLPLLLLDVATALHHSRR